MLKAVKHILIYQENQEFEKNNINHTIWIRTIRGWKRIHPDREGTGITKHSF